MQAESHHRWWAPGCYMVDEITILLTASFSPGQIQIVDNLTDVIFRRGMHQRQKTIAQLSVT